MGSQRDPRDQRHRRERSGGERRAQGVEGSVDEPAGGAGVVKAQSSYSVAARRSSGPSRSRRCCRARRSSQSAAR